MPPQNVASRRITSTAGLMTFAASCSKLTTTVLVAVGMRTESRILRIPFIPQVGSSKQSFRRSSISRPNLFGVLDGVGRVGTVPDAILRKLSPAPGRVGPSALPETSDRRRIS